MFSSNSAEVDTLTQRPSGAQTTAGSTARSRFSFFRKPTQSQLSLTADGCDELSQLDIREALFPTGQPDEFSPAVFKDLQLHAEVTLQRFQAAHIEQQKILKSVTAAKKAQADDLEAAETRNEHLKLQLGEMAERAAEQERRIAELKAELDAVRQQPAYNAYDVGLAQGGIRKVSQNSAQGYRQKRASDVSTSESESGSDIISIFSDPMSAVESPGTSVAASPVIKHATMYQTRIEQPTTVIPVPECQKCHGLRPDEAWDVVSMMKVESGALKQRIAELEGAHDDALAFLKSLNIGRYTDAPRQIVPGEPAKAGRNLNRSLRSVAMSTSQQQRSSSSLSSLAGHVSARDDAPSVLEMHRLPTPSPRRVEAAPSLQADAAFLRSLVEQASREKAVLASAMERLSSENDQLKHEVEVNKNLVCQLQGETKQLTSERDVLRRVVSQFPQAGQVMRVNTTNPFGAIGSSRPVGRPFGGSGVWSTKHLFVGMLLHYGEDEL
ncbi:hypothetical protein DV737_g5110, partial [Chaetothyriales sp. CBS 132003]